MSKKSKSKKSKSKLKHKKSKGREQLTAAQELMLRNAAELEPVRGYVHAISKAQYLNPRPQRPLDPPAPPTRGEPSLEDLIVVPPPSLEDLIVVPPPAPEELIFVPLPDAPDADRTPKLGRPVTRSRRARISKSVPALSVPVPIAPAPTTVPAPPPLPRTYKKALKPPKTQKAPRSPRIAKPRASRSTSGGSRRGRARRVPSPTRVVVYPPITRAISPREWPPIPEVGGVQSHSPGPSEASRASQSSPSTVLSPGVAGDIGSTLADLHAIYQDRDSTPPDTNDSFVVESFEPQNLGEDTESQEEIIDVEEISQENFAQVNVSQDSLDVILPPQMLNSNIFDMPDFPDNFLEALDDDALNDADDPDPPDPPSPPVLVIDCSNHVSGGEDEPEVEENPPPDPHVQELMLQHRPAPYALQLPPPNVFNINIFDDSDDDDEDEDDEIEPNERNHNILELNIFDENDHVVANGDLNPIEPHVFDQPINNMQEANAELGEPNEPNVQPANRPRENEREDRD